VSLTTWIATGWRRFTYFTALCCLLLSGCGGDGSKTVTIGGTVSGLLGTLVLQNNAGDNLTIAADGAFTFATPVSKGAPYAVTILTQPSGPPCAVASGSGTSPVPVTNVSVTCTVDPATVFVPFSATPDNGAPPEAAGLFVASTNSPGDRPIQITTKTIRSIGMLSRYTLSPQGTASVAGPYAVMYTTLNSPSGDRVWSVRLSGTSTLTPTQISSFTFSQQSCSEQLIAKDLADPSSAFLILALPADATTSCNGDESSYQWLLIHFGDRTTTAPVSLSPLQSPIRPLYRPDGKLAGLLATDTAHNLNFYPDETFTNPKVLLTNAGSFSLVQEPQPVGSSAVSVDPTYGFLLVLPPGPVVKPFDVYHVDYSGAISAKLYSLQNVYNGLLVDAHTLYYVETAEAANDDSLLTVGRINSSGGPVLTLANIGLVPGYYIPVLVGITGSRLVFEIEATYFDLWSVVTVPTDANAIPTTIVNGFSGHVIAAIADGKLLLTVTSYGSAPSGELRLGFSSEVVDVAGNVLQPLTPFSAFITSGAPAIQVKDIPTYYDMRGGQLYAFDPSAPADSNTVPLTTSTGAPYTLPTGAQRVLFEPFTPTISIAPSIQAIPDGPLLIYNQSTGVVAPISIPNSTLELLTQPD